MIIEMNRKELKNRGASMYAEGTVIKCNKYYIHISYDNGKWKYASMVTKVNTIDNMNDLTIGKQPQYIRDFIEDNNLGIRDFNYKIGEKIHHIATVYIDTERRKTEDKVIKDRIDVITDINYNLWGDMQYNTKEINQPEGENPKIGRVYEKWITRAS